MQTETNKLYAELVRRPPKYGAKHVLIDGYRFDSKGESERYKELVLLQKAGQIEDLKVHPQFLLEVNGKRICVYEADYSYTDKKGKLHVEDFKGARTAVFVIKKNLMRALLGIEVEEIRVKRNKFHVEQRRA